MGASSGSIGPANLNNSIKVLSDRTVAKMSDFIVGANKDEFLAGVVNWGRDLRSQCLFTILEMLRKVIRHPMAREKSIQRGIEVGHIFYLETNILNLLELVYSMKKKSTIILK